MQKRALDDQFFQPRHHRRAAVVTLLGLYLFVLGASGCSRSIVLRSPTASPGARYECPRAPGPRAAAPACVGGGDDVPGEDNAARTGLYALPAKCPGHSIQEIVIHDAGSVSPRVLVRCGTSGAPVGEMGADASPAPTH